MLELSQYWGTEPPRVTCSEWLATATATLSARQQGLLLDWLRWDGAKTEREERDAVFQAVLGRADDALDRSESLYAQGIAVAATTLITYVDLLLARFNLALAQWKAGNSDWQGTLEESGRDADFERRLADHLSGDDVA